MTKYYSFAFVVAFIWSFGQSTIRVREGADGKPIANANVLCNSKIQGKTNTSGSFVLKGKCKSLKIRATGYYEEEVVMDKVMEVQLTRIENDTKGIETVVIADKSDPRALAILKKVNEFYDQNSPKSLDSYQYKSYDKISFDLDKDTVDEYTRFVEKRIDSLRTVKIKKQTEKQKEDSLNMVGMMKVMTQSQLFLWERVSEFLYSKKYGEKINILDNRISGLQKPLYEMMALRTNRSKIPKEINAENVSLYRYFLTDTIQIDGRENYVIRFRETNVKKQALKRKYNGYIYVDAKTYGIKKIESNSTKKNEGSITTIWIPIREKWFIQKEKLKIKAGETTFKDPNEKLKNDSKNLATKEPPKKPKNRFGNYIYISSTFFDHESPIKEKPSDFSGYTIGVKNSDGSLLEKYRTDSLDVRELKTYEKIDSVGKKFKIDQKVGMFTSLLKGKVRAGMVDFDLGKFFKLNKYERVRFGVGVKLNEKFNDRFSPDAYLGYGIEDKKFKFGIGVDYKASKNITSIFRAEYYDDIVSAGRFHEVLWNFPMTASNAAVELNNGNFYHFKGLKFSYETDLSNSVTFRISAKRDQESALFPYQFQGFEKNWTNFSLNSTIKFAPRAKNIMTPTGKYTYEQGLPELYVNYEQALKTLSGEMNYSVIDFLLKHQVKSKLGKTGFRIHGGVLIGEAPIWHNFSMNGLSKFQPSLNVNFTSYLGFATMQAGKYYNDKFAGLFVTHRIPWYFRTIGKKTSSLDLVYRSAIGNMKNPNFHQFQFQKMDRLYQEVGVEWNKFLSSSFNLGFFYRVGAYNTNTFKEDFAVQLKFDLGL